jgi:serine/threonine-protein kinase HipA
MAVQLSGEGMMNKAKRTPNGRPVLCATTGRQLVAGIEYSSLEEECHFHYSPPWWTWDYSYPLSPHIPLNGEMAHLRVIRDYLFNLLPEGEACWEAARRYQFDRSNVFALVMRLCCEPAGAIGFDLDVDDLAVPDERVPSVRELPNKELSQRIRERSTIPFSFWDGVFYQSLAGVQDKLQVRLEGDDLQLVGGCLNSTHIMKPEPRGKTKLWMVANEHFCMTLARAVGLLVANVEIRRVPEPVLLIERFDRARSIARHPDMVERVHTIDACQALGEHPFFKYECPEGHGGGYRAKRTGIGFHEMFELERHFMVPREGKMAIVRWALFNMLIGNSDAHAKNLSFFQLRLGIMPAPAYDLVCTRVYDMGNEMAMAVGNAFLVEDVIADDLTIFAEEAGITSDMLLEELKGIASAAMTHATILAKSDVYTEQERTMVRKIVSSIEGRAVHLLSVASALHRRERLGQARGTGLAADGSLDAAQGEGEARPSQRILEHKEEVRRIVTKFSAENPRLYGPSAGGQDSNHTGLYLLVDTKEAIKAGDLGRIQRMVSGLIGAEVTIRTPGELSADTRNAILAKAKSI